ncbi:hypothetical protein ACLOJK_035461 [Asimina triloba]
MDASLLPPKSRKSEASWRIFFLACCSDGTGAVLRDDVGDGNIMRTLAPLLRTYVFGRNYEIFGGARRRFSSLNSRDELSMEEEAERKIGWLLKLFFAGTATFVGYQFFPYMDERRMKIVEIGGAKELLKMLEVAKDDRTRKEALKALVAISRSDVEQCHHGALANGKHGRLRLIAGD